MTKAFDKILAGLNEARAFARSKPKAGTRVHAREINRIEVAALRLKIGLTQAQFAGVLGTSLGTVRKWESGERLPSGAAARLLELLAAKPRIVTQTLGIKPGVPKRQPRSPLVAAGR